jgi:dienelactone hydrolase
MSIALIAAALLASPASQAAETISIPSNPIPTASGARPSPSPLTGRLTVPDGPGPHPAVILLHGCGGIGNGVNLRRWADRVNDWGYAALILDSFRPRNIVSVCPPEDQPKVTALDRSGDVLNAAIALGAQPGIDGNRIGVIGFSHGGATASTLTRRAFNQFRPGLIKASVDYYGPCREPQFYSGTPLLALAGDADNWGNPAESCTAFQARLATGLPMEVHVYSDVVHSFDNPDVNPRRNMLGHPMQYDWTASRDSFERTHAFLDRYVRKAPAK